MRSKNQELMKQIIHESEYSPNARWSKPDYRALFFPLTFDLVPFNRDGDLDWSDIYEDAGDEYADG